MCVICVQYHRSSACKEAQMNVMKHFLSCTGCEDWLLNLIICNHNYEECPKEISKMDPRTSLHKLYINSSPIKSENMSTPFSE